MKTPYTRLGIKAAIALIAMASLLTVAAAPALAQDKAPRLGIVDVDRVTRQSESIQNTIRKAEGAVQSQQQKIDQKTDNLQQLRQDLRQQASVLTEEEAAAKEKQLRDLKEEIDDLQYEVNKQLDRIRVDLMNPEVDRIMDTVRKVAEKEGYDLVIRADMALYYNEKADLTALVIKELDKENAKQVVPKPEAAKPEDAKDKDAKPAATDKP